MSSYLSTFKRKLTRRKTIRITNVADSYNISYDALCDDDLAESGIYWSDFPIRFFDASTWRSTRDFMMPDNLWKRLRGIFKRVSVVDMNMVVLHHLNYLNADSLAMKILGTASSRFFENLRVATNTPAPSMGVSRRMFDKYGSCRVAQDALPWVPTSCKKSSRGMHDASLKGTLCCIGRAGARPIRLPLVSIWSSAITFVLYLVGTILYLSISTACELAPDIPCAAFIRELSVAPSPLRHTAGILIVSSLIWSTISFIFGIAFVHIRRHECLSIVQNECAEQNALWIDEFRLTEQIQRSGRIRQMYVIETEESLVATHGSLGELSGKTKLYQRAHKQSEGICNSLANGFRTFFKGSQVKHYAIRYVEYPSEFLMDANTNTSAQRELSGITLNKNPVNEVAFPDPPKAHSDDHDPSESDDSPEPIPEEKAKDDLSSTDDDEEESFVLRRFPVPLVPVVQCMVFTHAIFQPLPAAESMA